MGHEADHLHQVPVNIHGATPHLPQSCNCMHRDSFTFTLLYTYFVIKNKFMYLVSKSSIRTHCVLLSFSKILIFSVDFMLILNLSFYSFCMSRTQFTCTSPFTYKLYFVVTDPSKNEVLLLFQI